MVLRIHGMDEVRVRFPVSPFLSCIDTARGVIKQYMKKRVVNFARKHKVYAGLIVVLVFVAGYFIFRAISGDGENVRYVFAQVRRGTIETFVSGSGQVSASTQIEVKAKASGEAIALYAVAGKYVNAGAILAELDANNARKSVRDAELSFESARIAYEKVRGPSSSAVPRLKEQAAINLARAYDDGFSAAAAAFIDIPSLLTNFKNLQQDKTFDKNQENISWYANQIPNEEEIAKRRAVELRDSARSGYDIARASYDKSFDLYKKTSRYSEQNEIERLVSETYKTTQFISDAVKTNSNYIDFARDFMETNNYAIPTAVSTQQSSLNSFTGTLNGHLTKLLSSANTIKDAKDAYTNADLDLASQELSLKQKENALADAKEKLADYTVRAPFAGIVAKVNIEKNDDVLSGTSVATLITTRKIAEISLNEVDAAQVSIGQKTKLSFDALPEMKADGVVSEMDTVGTMSQGVVSYVATISFTSPDSRIKPGMSVTADIIMNKKENVLLVPNSAIKTSGNRFYVESLSVGATSPSRAFVGIGLANDETTEIITGLTEGDTIIARTIDAAAAANTATTNQQNNAVFRFPGTGGRMR